MMKFVVAILLSALLAYASGLYLPWWSIAIACCIVAIVIDQKPVASFLSAFTALFLLWMFMVVSINSLNDNVLAPKISQIMGMGGSGSMLVLLTSLIGGIVGGLGALVGSLGRKMGSRE